MQTALVLVVSWWSSYEAHRLGFRVQWFRLRVMCSKLGGSCRASVQIVKLFYLHVIRCLGGSVKPCG